MRIALAICIASLAVGCRPRVSAPSSEIVDEAELRRRVATNPRDRAAQRDLGRAYLRRAVKGAALRHFERAGNARAASDSAALAALYAERAQFRLAAGDLAALDDLEAARKLGGEIDPALEKQARYAAALAAFRRGDREGLADGAALLLRAKEAHGPDARLAAAQLDLARLEDLAAAATWLERGGAKRASLEAYRTYWKRGGRDRFVGLGLKRMESWWGSLSEAPEPIEKLIVTSLRAWLFDRPSETRAVWRRIRQFSGNEIASVPSWARPTIHRVRGNDAAASSALEALRSTLGELEPEQEALVLLELALAEPSAPLPIGRGDLSWLVHARARRAGVASALESGWATREVPAELQRIESRVALDLAALAGSGDEVAAYAADRLVRIEPEAARALGVHRSTPAVWVAPLGSVDPIRLARDFDAPTLAGELAAIASSLSLDPVVSERLAREFVDRAIAPHWRGQWVVELFVRAGDPARAARFAEELLEASPEHPEFLALAAARQAAASNAARAKILASKAAARSGDAGLTLRHLTGEFASAGAHLAAVELGRRALGLSAPRHHRAIAALIARAMLELDRQSAAITLLVDVGMTPEEAEAFVAEKTLETDALFGAGLAWNPNDATLLAADARSSSATAADSANRLAAAALYSSDGAAMARWADLLESRGESERASAARREARGRPTSFR